MEEIRFEQLMKTFANDVFRICYMYLRDWQLAEEAMQDTFVKVYEKYGQFRGDANIKTWIMHIAINICKNYKRSHWFRVTFFGEWVEKANKEIRDIEAEVLKKDASRQLLEIVMSLKAKEKEVILLYYYQEMKISEVAEVLGVKEATVKTRLRRVRKKMKALIGEEEAYV